MRRWVELSVFLAAACLVLAAGSAQAQTGQCQCREAFDSCLIGDWLVTSEAVHPHWRASAARRLGMKVKRTQGQIELAIRKDRLFHARIALDSTAQAPAGLPVASRVTGSPVGRVCVAQNGELCAYDVQGDIKVSNVIKMSGRKVKAPGITVPAAGQNGNRPQLYPYRCTGDALEITFTNFGKREQITARRR